MLSNWNRSHVGHWLRLYISGKPSLGRARLSRLFRRNARPMPFVWRCPHRSECEDRLQTVFILFEFPQVRLFGSASIAIPGFAVLKSSTLMSSGIGFRVGCPNLSTPLWLPIASL